MFFGFDANFQTTVSSNGFCAHTTWLEEAGQLFGFQDESLQTHKSCNACIRLLHSAFLTDGRKARTSSGDQPRAFVKARSEIPSSPSRNIDRSQAPISFWGGESTARSDYERGNHTILLSLGHIPTGIGISR